ncbi:MAG: universal stress protein [Planctomycetes bacterium]|nr:universal stress protein [Planctomycetota bacterium]
MKTILAPVDFSDITEVIVEEACKMAKAFRGKVILLNVAIPSPYPTEYIIEGGFVPPPVDSASVREQTEKSEKLLHELAGKWQSDEYEMEIRVIGGEPVPVILDFCENNGVDMIMMGSHGHGALYHLLLGGVSEKILHRATCPVMIIRSEHHKLPEQRASA